MCQSSWLPDWLTRTVCQFVCLTDYQPVCLTDCTTYNSFNARTDKSCLTISTSCPLILGHARFFLNLNWYHIRMSETLVISSYTNASPSPNEASSLPCWWSQCQTCMHLTSQTILQGPKGVQHLWPLHLSVWMLFIAFLVVAAITYTLERLEGN